MGTDPPYIPAKFGEDSLKPKKVMAKNHRIVDEKKKKLQEQKDIPITWGCPNNNNNTDEFLQKQKNIPRHGDVLIIIRILMKSYKNKRTSTYMWMS